MSSIESYFIAGAFILLTGVFSGPGKYLVMIENGRNRIDLPKQMSPPEKLVIMAALLISIIYSILWTLTTNPIAIYILGYILFWAIGSNIGQNYFKKTGKKDLSLIGIIWVPTTYHLISPYVVKIVE
ncbi:hypothetical protein ACQKDY_02905 [Alteromonas macleodii]|uniref:hypothetical protein n=1 Tax=Alteromonas macleodii TaxID=28108 RepID=UPI003D02351B